MFPDLVFQRSSKLRPLPFAAVLLFLVSLFFGSSAAQAQAPTLNVPVSISGSGPSSSLETTKGWSGRFSASPSSAPVQGSECTAVSGGGSPGAWSGASWNWTSPTVTPLNGSPSDGLSASYSSGADSDTVQLAISTKSSGSYSVTLTANVSYSSTCQPAAGSKPITFTVNVVSVSKIQWKLGSSYVDVPSPFYVPTGVQLSFKAIPTPAGATWPSGLPTWSGNLVSGSGETQTVTPSSLGQKTISVTCGGTVSINLVVYDIKPIFTPVDNFDGRSTTDVGVGEQIQLSAQILTADPTPTPGPSSTVSYKTRGRRSLIHNVGYQPRPTAPTTRGDQHGLVHKVGYQLVQTSTAPSLSASDIGGLNWSMDSGDGTLTDGGSLDGSGSYTVGDSVGKFTLDLEVSSGPFGGFMRTQYRSQVAPTSATFYKVPGGYSSTAGLYHRYGTQSAGFNAAIKLSPSNVSFAGLFIQEGACPSVVTGGLTSHSTNAGTPLRAYPNNPLEPFGEETINCLWPNPA